MKKRPALITLLFALALVLGWFLSSSLRAAGYELVFYYGPESSRRWAITKLEGCGDPGLLALVAAMKRDAAEGAELTLISMTLRRHPRGPRALALGLSDPDPVVRLRSADSLYFALDREIGGDSLSLKMGFDDEDEAEEIKPLSAEQRQRYAPAIAALRRALSDPEGPVRASAIAAFALLPEESAGALPQLSAALYDTDPFAQAEAEEALALVDESADPALEGFLAKLLADLEARPLGSVVSSLESGEELRGARLIGAAIFTDDTDPRIDAALWYLRRLRRRSLPRIALLLRLVSVADSELREEVALSLMTRGDDGLAALVALLDGPAASQAAEAILGLAEDGGVSEAVRARAEALLQDAEDE